MSKAVGGPASRFTTTRQADSRRTFLGAGTALGLSVLAARGEAALFPALHDLVTPSEYDALGEDFERREHQMFGKDGFEHAVAEVAAVEKTLGIEELAQFTPK